MPVELVTGDAAEEITALVEMAFGFKTVGTHYPPSISASIQKKM